MLPWLVGYLIFGALVIAGLAIAAHRAPYDPQDPATPRRREEQ